MDQLRYLDNVLEWIFRQGFSSLVVFAMNLGALVIALLQVGAARRQAAQARDSASAAEQSANEAWATLSAQMLQTSLGTLSDQVRQVTDAVGREDWRLANIRALDFCENLRRLEASMSAPQKRALKTIEPAVEQMRTQLSEKNNDPAYVLLEDFTHQVNAVSDFVNRELGSQTVKP